MTEGRTKKCQKDGKRYKTKQIVKNGRTYHCMYKNGAWVNCFGEVLEK